MIPKNAFGTRSRRATAQCELIDGKLIQVRIRNPDPRDLRSNVRQPDRSPAPQLALHATQIDRKALHLAEQKACK